MSAKSEAAEWVCSYDDLRTGLPVTERLARIGGFLISDLWLTQYEIVRETDREVVALWPPSNEVVTGAVKARVLVIDKRAGQFRIVSVYMPAREHEHPGLTGACIPGG